MILSRPDATEIEVTLIGPGFGESVLIHIGSGRWIVVDSCRDSACRSSAPLRYLEQIGVDPASSVDLVVATHWHDDHIGGLSDVVEACTNAKFCCSTALSKEEFIAVVTRFDTNSMLAGGSGVRELNKIYSLLPNRTAAHAMADRRLLTLPPGHLSHGHPCELWTLSPSDKQIELFLMGVASLTPLARETQYRIPATDRNDLSVVLWISVGTDIVLLGADLAASVQTDIGWSAILSSKGRPAGRASVFKLPHHGSPTGHSDAVWESMVVPNVFAIMSPFNRGRKKLPSAEDIDRISAHTERAFVTSIPTSASAKRRSNAVEKTIRETVGKLRLAEARTGCIRLRRKLQPGDDNWSVELFSDACHASEFRRRIR